MNEPPVLLLNIGYGNSVSAGRIVAVVTPDSAPVKRVVNDARENGRLVDATCGRRARAALIMDSGHVVLSAILPETIGNRLSGSPEKHDPQEL